jgi:hypothetical protein
MTDIIGFYYLSSRPIACATIYSHKQKQNGQKFFEISSFDLANLPVLVFF